MSSDNAEKAPAAAPQPQPRSRAARFGSGLWLFLNSSFGLWLMSSVVLSAGTVLVPQWWARFQEAEENERQLKRIGQEIICRLQVSITIANSAAIMARDASYDVPDLPEILLSGGGKAAEFCNIQMTGTNQTLHALLAEWQRLAPGYVGINVERSSPELLKELFGDLATADVSTLTDDVRSVAAGCLGEMSSPEQPDARMGPAFERCQIAGFSSAATALLIKVRNPLNKVIATPAYFNGVRG